MDQSAPYFPIELSRTATGPTAMYVFPLGWVLTCWAFYLESAGLPNQSVLLTPVPGLLLTAFVHDELHFGVHCLGVGLMVMGVFANVVYITLYDAARAVGAQACFAMAVILANWAGVLKVAAVLDNPFEWRCWKLALTSDRRKVMDDCFEINYHGTTNRYQLVVYRVTGVMQWASLVLLMNVV
jgi:hypothetical protein